MPEIVIAVVGPGSGADDALLGAAEAVGRELAAAGATVVCGGLGGVMTAVARGVRTAGGNVVGLLPGADRRDGNEHLTVAVATGLGEARNTIIVRTADAVIAVGGAYGTLSEIAFALKLGRPVVGYRSWELSRDGTVDDGIIVAESPTEAVRLALQAAGAA